MIGLVSFFRHRDKYFDKISSQNKMIYKKETPFETETQRHERMGTDSNDASFNESIPQSQENRKSLDINSYKESPLYNKDLDTILLHFRFYKE